MRPAGEIAQALLSAAREMARECDSTTGQRGATMAELAVRAQVSRSVATDRVKKLRERGHLRKVGERRVGYRNRPVAVYAPAAADDDVPAADAAPLVACVSGWFR